MPKAKAGYVAGGDDRVPRTLFGHAHKSGDNTFPPSLVLNDVGKIILEIPANWNGIDELLIKVVPDTTNATWDLNITVCGGTDTEAVNIHTQTVNPHTFNATQDVFNYVDLTAAFAAVLALLIVTDTITITVENLEDMGIILYGAVLTET